VQEKRPGGYGAPACLWHSHQWNRITQPSPANPEMIIAAADFSLIGHSIAGTAKQNDIFKYAQNLNVYWWAFDG